MVTGPRRPDFEEDAGDSSYAVDVSRSVGVQVGDGNTQIVYRYDVSGLTWTDGVAAPPLIGVSGAVASPYGGLSAFGERDAPFFFGREDAVSEILKQISQRLHDTSVLVVSG